MPKYAYLVLLMAALLMLTACESGGKFRVVNRTSYPLYTEVDGQPQVTISAGNEHIFNIDTPDKHLFSGTVKTRVPVKLVGETYSIYDDVAEAWTDSTTITIEVGQTLSAFVSANRASVKIVNAATQNVASAVIYRHNFISAAQVAAFSNIAPGEYKFIRVDYATPNSNFYYYAVLQLEDGTQLQYGGEQTVLLKDEQFLITVTDPQ